MAKIPNEIKTKLKIETEHQNNPRGMHTTEFWVTVLPILGCFVLVLFDKATLDQVWPIAAGLGGGYSLSRGVAKLGLSRMVDSLVNRDG